MNGLSLAEVQTWGRWHGGFRIQFQQPGSTRAHGIQFSSPRVDKLDY